MKKKTYIQPGAYQKIPNTAGANIKGALNFNKEVLDTLVDKDVLGTVDCCQYFPEIPLMDTPDYSNPSQAVIDLVPIFGMFATTNGVEYTIWIKTPSGTVQNFTIV